MKLAILYGMLLCITIILIFGIIFIGLIVHEVTHIIQVKNPTSICYDMKYETFAHIEYTIPPSELDRDIRLENYREKQANLIEMLIKTSLAVMVGFILNILLCKFWGEKK